MGPFLGAHVAGHFRHIGTGTQQLLQLLDNAKGQFQAEKSAIGMHVDGDLPPAGPFPLKGHESVIILNMNEQAVDVKMTLYFTDKDPVVDIPVVVEANRVRCLRMDDPSDLAGFVLERDTQYAIKLECSLPVVAQYGRLDTREQPLSFYTTPGYSQ